MRYSTLEELLSRPRNATVPLGPIAVVFCEDGIKTHETLQFLAKQGFAEILLITATDTSPPDELEEIVHSVALFFRSSTETAAILNRIIEACPDRWIFWCYNAEFLYFPHCETRTIADVTTFLEEERRTATIGQIVDLYSDDLTRDGNAICMENAYFDVSGYYSLQRYDGPEALPDQYDLLGGLKWRFEEHVPYKQRFIHRVSLFRSASGLEIDETGTFNIAEYNTISCPWHNNLTVALASFRTAKALLHNPGSRAELHSFIAPQSHRFEWKSQQLLELGFMEPGQWF